MPTTQDLSHMIRTHPHFDTKSDNIYVQFLIPDDIDVRGLGLVHKSP